MHICPKGPWIQKKILKALVQSLCLSLFAFEGKTQLFYLRYILWINHFPFWDSNLNPSILALTQRAIRRGKLKFVTVIDMVLVFWLKINWMYKKMFIDLEARYINVSKGGREVWLVKLQLNPQCARMNFKNVLDWFYVG